MKEKKALAPRLLYGLECGFLLLLVICLCLYRRSGWRVSWLMGAGAVITGSAGIFWECYTGAIEKRPKKRRRLHALLTGAAYGLLMTVPFWGNYSGWLWLQLLCFGAAGCALFGLLYLGNWRRYQAFSDPESPERLRREAEGRAHAIWAVAAVLFAGLLAVGLRAKPINKEEVLSTEEQYRREVQEALLDYDRQESICKEERGIYLKEDDAKKYGSLHRFSYRNLDEYLTVNITDQGSEEEREAADVPDTAAYVWSAKYEKGDERLTNYSGQWKDADEWERIIREDSAYADYREPEVQVNQISSTWPDLARASRVDKEITETGTLLYTLQMDAQFMLELKDSYPADSIWGGNVPEEAIYALEVDENGRLMKIDYTEKGSNPELAVGYMFTLITRVCLLDRKRVEDEIAKQLEEVFVPVY